MTITNYYEVAIERYQVEAFRYAQTKSKPILQGSSVEINFLRLFKIIKR